MNTAQWASLKSRYTDYHALVGDAAFIDISRCTDSGRSNQPWQALEFIAQHYGWPQVVQVWTKGPRDVLRRGRALLEQCRERGAILLCQHSVTGFGPEIEPLVPWPIDWDGIDQMLAFLGTPDAMVWRYDPIIPGLTDLAVCEELSAGFEKLGVTRAVYNRGECGSVLVRGRMGEWVDRVDRTVDMNALSRGIEEIGRAHGIEFTTLAEGEQIDGELAISSRGAWQYEFMALAAEGFPSREMLPGAHRPGCMCAPSFDVGVEGLFDGCYKCVYCFAP